MLNKNKKKRVITKPLSGFMELMPAEQIVFNKMFDTIRQTYEVFGFIPLDTPILERAESLLAKAGGETEKQIYQFKKGDTNLAMRFDLTVPLARYVAEYYGDLVFPFRRYTMGKVFRGERPQAGRFREFYQCDIDVVDNGQLDLQFDAEISSIIYTIFQKLGFKNFTIRINNRKIFDGLFAELGITKKSSNIMQAIDKLEKVGNEAVKNELKKLLLSPEVVERIFNFIGLKGSSDNVIAGLQSLGIDNIQFKNGVKELVKVVSLIKQFGVPESNFTVDLTIARGLDYYTGTVYETFLDDYPEIGSVCSGGRYDNLISHYTSRKISGVGISIGLTRLFNQLYKKGILQTSEPTLTKVLVLPMTEDVKYSLEIATKLRKNGISTEISFVQGKMKKRLRYADRLGIPYVVFIGEDEIRKGVYTLRDLVTGNQKELGERELLTKFSKK